MGKDGKPKGKLNAYAYFVQTCREEHKKKHPTEQIVFAEFSKKCAAKWKTMGAKEKQRFEELATKDKARFDGEMADYKPAKGEKGEKRKRGKKDPNAPKRNLSAFFFFCAQERPAIKEQNPEYSVGDIAKVMGKRWSAVTASDKAKYEALAAKDKIRYEKESAEYKKTGGVKKTTASAATAKHQVDEDDEEEDEEDEEEDEESD